MRDALPAGVTLRDLGEHRFKDLGRPERVLQLVIAGLPADFPPIRSLDAVPNNLPMQVTSFIGREREIAEGVRLFQQARVLTLTGPGGTGKTRLSLQIAANVAHGFPGGVTFVALAPISDPELVAPAIVDALHLEAGRARRATGCCSIFAISRRCWCMDNFEQVLAAATLVADLIRRQPGPQGDRRRRAARCASRASRRCRCRRSRSPIRARRPSACRSTRRCGCSSSARVAVKPGFAVTNENAPAVAEICARLDGLPLAIELAAARIKLLPPAAILTRLQSRLGLLQSSARDLPDRQKTLRGAIAWSHDLLDEPGRRLFARLAVFAGGGVLDDVEAISAAPSWASTCSMGSRRWSTRAWCGRRSTTARRGRSMLETIREFALEQLAAGPDAAAVRNRHALCFLALAEEAGLHLLHVERRAWLARLEREHDNLRAAFDFCAGSGRIAEALRMAAALWRFWQFRGHLREGLQRVQRVLDDPASRAHPVAREAALEASGGLSYWLGEMTATESAYKEALALARANGDPARISNALYNFSFLPVWIEVDRDPGERPATPTPSSTRGWPLHRQVGDRGAIARCLWAKGNITPTCARPRGVAGSARRGDPDLPRARRPLRPRLGAARRGARAPQDRRPAAARAAFDEQVALLGEARDPSGMAIALSNQSQLAVAEGDGCAPCGSRAPARRSATSPAPSWCRRSTRSRGA